MKTWKLWGMILGTAATWLGLGGCNPNSKGRSDSGNDSGIPVCTTGSSVDVTPTQASVAVMSDTKLTLTLTDQSGSLNEDVILTVTSSAPTVVAVPAVGDFVPALTALAAGPAGTFTYTSSPKATTQVTLSCLSAGTAKVTFEAFAGCTGVIDVTCTKSTAKSPVACIVPLFNETLKGLDDQGKLVDVPGWGQGPGLAVTPLGTGTATVAAASGHDGSGQPTVWLSEAFDPASAGPTTWTPHSPAGAATGEFGDVAPYGSGVVATNVNDAIYLFDGSTFQKGTSPDMAGTVACDESGTCIAGASNGGILRSTDGLAWASNGGTERLSPLEYCNGVFVAYDIFGNQQLWSDDGGQTWQKGDLSAFNVNSFACGSGVWVAAAQGATWLSADQAKTWTKAANAVGKVAFSAAANAFFAAGDGAGVPTVWTSTDGNTWTQTDDLGSGGFNSIGCF